MNIYLRTHKMLSESGEFIQQPDQPVEPKKRGRPRKIDTEKMEISVSETGEFKPAETAAAAATTEDIQPEDSISVIIDSAKKTTRKPRAKKTEIPEQNPGQIPQQDSGMVYGFTPEIAREKINEFRDHPIFAEKLKTKMKFPTQLQLLKMSPDELNDILRQIKHHLGNKFSMNNIADTAVPIMSRAYESILVSLGLPMDGLAEALSKNQEIREIISELIWIHGRNFELSAELRLVLAVGVATISVYSANTARNQAIKLKQGAMSAEQINEKYKNL